MHDIKHIDQNFDSVVKALESRGNLLEARSASRIFNGLDGLKKFIQQRRDLIQQEETLKAEQNKASSEMGKLAKAGKVEELQKRAEELADLKGKIQQATQERAFAERQVNDILYQLPNVPHESVPLGKSEKDNVVVRTFGEKPKFEFEPKSYQELAGHRLDAKRGSNLAGSGNTVLWGLLATLERALVNFMITDHLINGYEEVSVPFLANKGALVHTGQLPKFKADLFEIGHEIAGDNGGTEMWPDDLFLIPTGEVPLTNLHQDEILDVEQLPLLYTAATPCFRREAGGYGKKDGGYFRQHQFQKVELVQFVEPETSLKALEALTEDAEDILKKLGLHYRVVELCTGDLGFGAQKTYDLEVWLPSQNAYREISSCSLMGDFQARRAKIRYRKGKKDKPQLVHTLNASGLAVGRTIIALLEQHQQEDGRVKIPSPLRQFFLGEYL